MPYCVHIKKLKIPTRSKDLRATPKTFKHSHLIPKPYEARKNKENRGGFETLLNKKAIKH